MKPLHHIRIVVFLCLLLPACASAEKLKPGFDPDEYIGVLKRSAIQVDMDLKVDPAIQFHYKRIYSSPEVGLHNKWDLWINRDSTILAVNLRGTTITPDSWLENFYTAMIPATGVLNLDGKKDFHYKFASNPRAAVHAGWAIGICSMIPDITGKLLEWHKRGVDQVIIEGHSQGGALAYLLSAHLHYCQQDGTFPNDIVMKTYCSAPPKAGNLYFAYDFDYINKGGWALSVENSADWVPEMPFSEQTVNEVNLNPFPFTKNAINKKPIARLYAQHMFNSLDRHTRKSERKNEKFLGKIMYKQVRKYLPGLQQPQYVHSCNYARAGDPIILHADKEYYQRFPDTGSDIFRNHLFHPYYYLVVKDYK